MQICHLCHSDIYGGAAKAAYRIHSALTGMNVASRLYVQKKLSNDSNVSAPEGYFRKIRPLIHFLIDEFITSLQQSDNPTLHTAWGFGSQIKHQTKGPEFDLVHLHWNRSIPSVSEIGKFTKPVVWTLHDMWPFCGSEHFAPETNARWQTSYLKSNRPPNQRGIDIDRLTWQKKKKCWKRPFNLVAPSNWMAECVRDSNLMSSWPVTVIPYPIDSHIFKPIDKLQARQILNLPKEDIIVLFGAIGGGGDLRKGFDLLLAALNDSSFSEISEQNIRCVVFGQSKPINPPQVNLPVTWFGPLHDECSLALLYNAADVMVIPSRQDNLPQTGLEAQSCGCPVVAFDIGGLPDIVDHKRTGYLAQPYDSHSLAEGIHWVVGNSEKYSQLSHRARERALKLWEPRIVANQYLAVYRQAIEQQSDVAPN